MVKFFTKPIFALFCAVAILFASCQTGEIDDISTSSGIKPISEIPVQYDNPFGIVYGDQYLISMKSDDSPMVIGTDFTHKGISYTSKTTKISDLEYSTTIFDSNGKELRKDFVVTLEVLKGDMISVTPHESNGIYRKGCSSDMGKFTSVGSLLILSGAAGCVPCAAFGTGMVVGAALGNLFLCND